MSRPSRLFFVATYVVSLACASIGHSQYQTQPPQPVQNGKQQLQRNKANPPVLRRPPPAAKRAKPTAEKVATATAEQPAAPIAANNEHNLLPRLAAEFEPQRAVMFSVCDLQPHNQNVLLQIVEKTHGHADLLIFYNNEQQLKTTVELLLKPTSNLSKLDHLLFYQLELDTVWLRDFGPRIAEDKSAARSLDFYYYGVRPFDDSFPERWALLTSGTVTKIPWTIQGGNLITNGQGLGITTKKIFEDNKVSFSRSSSYLRARDEGKELLVREIKQFCNLNELIVLEPLRNESTKHVDMFAAFLAPDHALVAQLDPKSDATNARILDWNARKLALVKVNGKAMQVDRIKIPVREGAAWSTYTNAIFTDRLVLMPTTSTDPSAIVSTALATFRRLLPNHHIATVDITSMKKLQGSLHCMSLNLPAFAPLPSGTMDFQQAKSLADRVRKNPNPPKQSFTIDKQLRRVFKSSTSDYLVDAYAVALDSDVVSLLRVADKKVIRVKTSGVCDSDRYWIQRNTKKIQTNGIRVHRWLMSQK